MSGSKSRLQSFVGPTALQVIGAQDKNPPVLTFFTYSPQSVDVTNGPATFNMTTQATDDLSGVEGIGVSWVSPDGTERDGNGITLSSRTNPNSTCMAPPTLPPLLHAS